MGIIEAVLSAVFGSLFEIGKKLLYLAPLILAFVAIFATLTYSYLTMAHFLLDGIAVTVPAVVLQVWGWLLPSNVFQCFSALFAARLIKWFYFQTIFVLTFKAKAVINSVGS
jgi:hypothetical protein